MADSVFDPKKCSIPDVPPIESMPVIEDCEVPEPPDPITDCPDIDLPIPSILGWMGFECIGGIYGPPPPGPPGPPGRPGDPGRHACIFVLTKVKCVKHGQPIRVKVKIDRATIPGCLIIKFVFYIYCGHHDKEKCCWWKYCPDYELPDSGGDEEPRFICEDGEDDGCDPPVEYATPYPDDADCPWVLITDEAGCKCCANGPCSANMTGDYDGQVEIWCDCNDYVPYDCVECGKCWFPPVIHGSVHMYYQYKVDNFTCNDGDGSPDSYTCEWTSIGAPGADVAHQGVTLTYDGTRGCWYGQITFPGFVDDWCKKYECPDPDGDLPEDPVGIDKQLCAEIAWCCDADDDECVPEMTIKLQGTTIPLTGRRDSHLGCAEVQQLEGGEWTTLSHDGWLTNAGCCWDCLTTHTEFPDDDPDGVFSHGCVDWCHGYQDSIQGGEGHVEIHNIPKCPSDDNDNSTYTIRLIDFELKIDCDCCENGVVVPIA